MKIGFLLIIICCYSFFSKADLGYPTIQAVCSVTLINGNTIEGLIKLGSGGYNGFCMNGFCFKCSNTNRTYSSYEFFSLDSKIYYFKNDIYKECNSIKYLQVAFNDDVYYNAHHVDYDSSGVADTFRIVTVIEKKYIALDSMVVYLEPSPTTYLDTMDFGEEAPRRIKFIMIAMKDIAKLELLSSPAPKWIKLIEDANDKAQEKYNGEDSSGDFLQAAWYHSIVSDSTLYNEYQPVIKFNIDR